MDPAGIDLGGNLPKSWQHKFKQPVACSALLWPDSLEPFRCHHHSFPIPIQLTGASTQPFQRDIYTALHQFP